MSQQRKNFELLGSIGDHALRKNIAAYVYKRLSVKQPDGAEQRPDAGNFTSAIEEILSDGLMKQLCSEDPALAEKVTGDILKFINGVSKAIITAKSPYEEEQHAMENFRKTEEPSFSGEWNKVQNVIKANYPRRAIDCDFHTREFLQCLEAKKDTNQHLAKFKSVKEHFLEKWELLLFQKQAQWELNIIDNARNEFCHELYARMKELKELRDILDPLTEELGRLWDLSQGKWRKADMDLLKRYSDLLKNNTRIKEFVNLLGRMRQSERAMEEELYSRKVIKQEWKISHSAKSDLIGVTESDDLSSLIPGEVALLADPELEIVFLKKYAEKKLQTFEHQERYIGTTESNEMKTRQKPDSKGPIIICIDTSGSMHGTPELVAKTLCFAFTKIALRENRKVFLISFSTAIETIDLSDMKHSLHKTLAFLSMNFNGGTDGSHPLDAALMMLEEKHYHQADVMMVSDFIMNELKENTATKIKNAQNRKTRFHSLSIGNSANKKALECFDHNWNYDPSQPDAMMHLVRKISFI